MKGVARGYAACIYPGADVNDQSVAFRTAYGANATWGTIFARAWLAIRALDYLETVDAIDATRASISGHSRNGKQAMLVGETATPLATTRMSSGTLAGSFAPPPPGSASCHTPRWRWCAQHYLVTIC